MTADYHPSWFGWLYTPRGWLLVCSGATLGDCAAILSRCADERGLRDTDCLLTRNGAAPVGMPLGRVKEKTR